MAADSSFDVENVADLRAIVGEPLPRVITETLRVNGTARLTRDPELGAADSPRGRRELDARALLIRAGAFGG